MGLNVRCFFFLMKCVSAVKVGFGKDTFEIVSWQTKKSKCNPLARSLLKKKYWTTNGENFKSIFKDIYLEKSAENDDSFRWVVCVSGQDWLAL